MQWDIENSADSTIKSIDMKCERISDSNKKIEKLKKIEMATGVDNLKMS